MGGSNDAENIVLIILDFGTLILAEHILKSKLMEAENFADILDYFSIAESPDIDPSHIIFFQECRDLADVGDFALEQFVAFISDGSDNRCRRQRVGNQETRRRADARSFLFI
jgi:hypothetical protein